MSNGNTHCRTSSAALKKFEGDVTNGNSFLHSWYTVIHKDCSEASSIVAAERTPHPDFFADGLHKAASALLVGCWCTKSVKADSLMQRRLPLIERTSPVFTAPGNPDFTDISNSSSASNMPGSPEEGTSADDDTDWLLEGSEFLQLDSIVWQLMLRRRAIVLSDATG